MKYYNTLADIDKEGKLRIYGKNAMDDFMRQHKNSRVVVSLSVLEPQTNKRMLGYYLKKIVPEFRKRLFELGTVLSEQSTDEFLRKISPFTIREYPNDNGGYDKEIREIKDLSDYELYYHIAFLKQIGIEDYNIFIDEPLTI